MLPCVLDIVLGGIGLWACLWGIVLILDWCFYLSTVGTGSTGQVILGYIRKRLCVSLWASQQAWFHHGFCFKFLFEFLSRLSSVMQPGGVSQRNPSKLLLVRDFSHSRRVELELRETSSPVGRMLFVEKLRQGKTIRKTSHLSEVEGLGVGLRRKEPFVGLRVKCK